ncbi:MAG: ATP-dependent protease subunit HslV [Myxococcota bacterium]
MAEAMERLRATTVVVVIRDGAVAMASDGQVTVGEAIMKQGASKVRASSDGAALIGFAGGAADAMALTERLEAQLEAHPGNVRRAAVELAKDWRTDRALRRLEAMLVVADREHILVVSGNGDVIEPDDGLAAIGSGGGYALSAARALRRRTELTAAEIARESLEVAAEICVYTNSHITLVELT